MWQEKFIFRFFHKFSEIHIVQCNLVHNDEPMHYSCWLSKKAKDHVTFQKCDLANLKKSVPVIAVFTGNNFMEKRFKLDSIGRHEDADTAVINLIQQELPGITKNDFFIEYRVVGDEVVVRLARKQDLQKALQYVPKGKPVHFTLLHAGGVVPPKFNISPTKDQPGIVAEDEENAEIVDLTLDYFDQKWQRIVVNEEFHAASVLHYETQKVKALTFSLLLCLLCISLIGIFLDQYFQNTIALQKNKIQKIGNSKAEQVNVQATINTLGLVSQKAGLNQKTAFSGICDQIASTVPVDLTLTGLEVFPALPSQDEDSLQQFERKKILVSGYCTSATVFTEWVRQLSKLSIVSEVEQSKYNYLPEESRDKFDLQIKLK